MYVEIKVYAEKPVVETVGAYQIGEECSREDTHRVVDQMFDTIEQKIAERAA